MNNKIKQLITDRDAIIEKYNQEIQNEIDIEKSKYKFSWKRFLIVLGLPITMLVSVELNQKIFPETSIWSWEYYTGESIPKLIKNSLNFIPNNRRKLHD